MAGRASELRRAVSDEEKEVRRETILAAAKRVFSQHGYAATTVADVARAARLSYGTIYWYFESKEELFDALMDAGENSLRTRILDALEAAGPADLDGALRTAVGATFEHFDADRDAARLLFRDSYALGGRFERHLQRIYDGFVDDLESTIRDGQRSGAIRKVPSRLVAFSLAALIGQLAYRRLNTDDGMDPAALAEFVVSMVMEGLRPR